MLPHFCWGGRQLAKHVCATAQSISSATCFSIMSSPCVCDEGSQPALSSLQACISWLQNHTDARILLIRFQKLWGQPYVAPICTLLLHRALMEHKAKVTGEGDCSRVLNVMVEGVSLPAN